MTANGVRKSAILLVAAVAPLIGVVAFQGAASAAVGNGTTPSPAPRIAPTTKPNFTANAVDACLVGQWVQTSSTAQTTYTTFGTGRVTPYTESGGAGVVFSVASSGTAIATYNQSAPFTGTVNGSPITIVDRGSISYQVTTSGSTLNYVANYSNFRPSGTYLGGPLTFSTGTASGSTHYVCTATSLTLSSPTSQDNFTRVSFPYVGIAPTPTGGGYWLVDAQGKVYPHGNALAEGTMAGRSLNAPITHIVSTPTGKGYWLVAADGGTFAFGTAGFFGSMGGKLLNAPVVDIAPTSNGLGYWLVAADGGIFAFGNAVFHGSMGGTPLNKPVVGIAPDYATTGYWEVASDGGIFAFGAPFFGSTGSIKLNQPVNGMAPAANDQGYLFVASDGGVFAFGNAVFQGSMGGHSLNAPVVGMATDTATGGYWLLGADGGIFSFGAPFYGAGAG